MMCMVRYKGLGGDSSDEEREVDSHIVVSRSCNHMKMIEALSMSKGQVQNHDVGGWREDHCSHRRVSFGHSRWPGQVAFDRKHWKK